MDNVLVDFQSGIDRLSDTERQKYEGDLDDTPGIFSKMDPMPGAVAAFRELVECFDTYLLSTAPWNNSSAWSDKLLWVKKHLGDAAKKRLILSHNKGLNRGDYLVDDRPTSNGVDLFQGEIIHFGSDRFPDWSAVLPYLREHAEDTS
jgi:5'(3')-deoxyribonucleotidase